MYICLCVCVCVCVCVWGGGGGGGGGGVCSILIGNISALLALCAGNSPVAGEFPAQRPVTRNFAVLFDLRLNKRLRE